MTLLTASIVQFGDEPTTVLDLLSEPRYAVRITFAIGQAVWLVSHEDAIPSLPVGASVLDARLTDASMPNINRNAGFDTGKTTITSPTYEFVDNGLSDLFANKNVNGQGTFNRLIEEWEFEKGEPLQLIGGGLTLMKTPKFTGIIQNHETPLNRVVIHTADINRELDEEIFDPLQWRLRASISADQTSIATTLPPTQILSYQATFAHASWYLAHPNQTGGYFKIQETGEICWYTSFEDVNGVATFLGVERGQLRTIASAVTVEANTEDKNKPQADEWTLIDEPATDLVRALITGVTTDGRTLPAHWAAQSDAKWVNGYSFAKHATDLRFQFQNVGKVKCRDFYQSEILIYMGAVLTVNGAGQLVWTPRIRPIDEDSGEIVLSYANCVQTNDLVLKHVKTGIHPSVKLSFDFDAIADNYKGEYLNQVTYRDVESESHNGIGAGKRVKEFKSKGLHAGIHTGAQLQKLAATFGDDYFYEKLSLSVESFINTIELGSLVTVDFPNVLDDAAGKTTAQPLNRTMLVIASNENRDRRTTTYTLSGSLYVQSTRQASQSLHNIPVEEYKRGKVNLATLSGISVDNSIASGNITLNMGVDYYYVNDDSLGTGLELGANLNVTIAGTGRQIGLYVFGPLDIKCGLDFTGKSGHSGGIGATQNTSATRGATGYVGATRSSGSLGAKVNYSTFLSSNETQYRRSGFLVARTTQGLATQGQNSRMPDPVIDVNNGLLGGLPSDMGGVGGSGGTLSEFYDSDRRPRFDASGSTPSPSNIYIDGSNGGAGGGSFLTVSWGVSISGNGQVILNGSDAAPANSHTHGSQIIMGSRGAGGGAGAYLAIIDGNHPVPLFTSTNVIALHGDGAVDAAPVAINTKHRDAGSYRSAYQSISSEFNYFQSHARFAYTPDAENVQERSLSVFTDFFINQRDDLVKIIVSDVDPSNADPADMRITEANLNSGLENPPFRIFDPDGGGWRSFVYGVDKYKSIYLALIANKRDAGGDSLISSTTRPVGQDGNLWHNPNTGNTVRLLSDGPPDALVYAQDAPVGSNKYKDGNLARYKAGEITWVFTDDLDALPTFPPEQIGGVDTGSNTGGGFALSPVTQLDVYVYSGTNIEMVWGTPPAASSEGITGYEIRQDGALIDTVSGGSRLINGLTPSTSYTFSVRSVNGSGGRSADVSDTVITQAGGGGGGGNTLDPVTNLTASVYSSSSLELFWATPTNISNITGYEVRRDGTLIGTTGSASGSYFESALNPNTAYVYTVRSVNSTEQSSDSTVSATTQP